MLKEMVEKVSKVFGLHASDNDKSDGVYEQSETRSAEIIVPISGKILTLDSVPDQVFSKRLMGDGFAIEPTEGTVVSPVDGKVVNLLPTHNAIGIESTEGLEILIHVGIDTAHLKGEGFEVFVKQGDVVKKGQKLIEAHLNYVGRFVPSIISPIIFTNLEKGKQVQILKEGLIERGEENVIKIM